jgi:hypothetical protein
MHVYIDPLTGVWNTPAEHQAIEEYKEGQEFTLLSIDVIAANTYRIVNGVPELVKTAQPSGISDQD